MAIAIGTAISASAKGATEDECKAAIAKTQHDMESNAGVMMERDSIREEWDQALIRAGGYGQEGKPDRCLETVKDVRSQAGLPH
ncbi:MAG: hypothetical protein AAGF49_01925 [Pseudomonadota bacterium]